MNAEYSQTASATVPSKADQVQSKVFQAIDQLAVQLESDSQCLTQYLRMMGKFHRYSFYNILLITVQNPEATMVAGFYRWKDLERFVKKGEKGIVILAPVIKKQADESEKLVGFTTAHVWDVAQTSGEPLPEFASVKGSPKEWLQGLYRLCRSLDIEVKKTEAVRASLGVSLGGRILLSPNMTEAQEFCTLAHELAHEMLHTKEERATLPKAVMEVEAEAVSYVICVYAGLDTNTACSDYCRLYGGNPKLLRASLERIQRTSSAILDGIEAAAK